MIFDNYITQILRMHVRLTFKKTARSNQNERQIFNSKQHLQNIAEILYIIILDDGISLILNHLLFRIKGHRIAVKI